MRTCRSTSLLRRRRPRLALWVALLALGLSQQVHAQERHILLLEVTGIIDPATEGFIARGVRRAEVEGATLVIIQLDTPGGLLDSTRKITQHLLSANVPSVVFVAPRGGQAASAGTFITAAATFAVMAPATNIGAASPVAGGGEELPKTLKSKVMNDAAAEMRSIATLRGRNAEKLEATVLEAVAFTAEEAVEFGMVDFIAGDLDSLLAQLHGREAVVQPPEGRYLVLDMEGVVVRALEMSLAEQFLHFLSDPNISYMLLSLGSLGIFVELFTPGLILPGVVGVILLILAFITLGSLPVNWGGVALIFLAVALGLLEFYVAGFGALGVGAIVSFALGGLFLFSQGGVPSPTMPSISVNPWVLVPTVAVLGGGGGWLFLTIQESRRQQPATATRSLVGAEGHVTSDLAPRGTVQVASELWSAVAEMEKHIAAGERVTIVRVEGLVLTVRRAPRPS